MLKKALSVLLALAMLLTVVPLAFAAESPGVTCKVSATGSGNVILTFYGGPVTKLTNAVFLVEYDTSALEFVRASECKTDIDGDEVTNFQGIWAFGERADGSGVTAGFISYPGATKSKSTAMFEVEFKFKDPESEGVPVKAYIEEFGTDDGNAENDVAKSGSRVCVFEQSIVPPPEFLYGDANGDGKVDLKDVVLVRQYMANYVFDTQSSSVAVQAGADANGDGVVNLKDVVLLRQYMANFDYKTNSSTVVLGPR